MKNVLLPTRPYQLFFEHRPGYLFAYIQSGVNSLEITRGYWVEILSMVHRRRYKRVLIEENIPERLAVHDLFEIVSELAHSGCNSVSFAICDHYFDPEKSAFEEMVASNRGLRLKVGGDLPDLENWLVSQPADVSVPRGAFPQKQQWDRHALAAAA